MIYFDSAATSFQKPPAVRAAVERAMQTCASVGRGGHQPAINAAQTVFGCRELAAELFDCEAEQVAFTMNATHGLNIAIRTLVPTGGRVVVSGFEHNAVTRPLHALHAEQRVAGQVLFSPQDTLECFEDALKSAPSAAICNYVSNVFGYVLPINGIAALCRLYDVPLIIDASQAAGTLPVSLRQTGARFIAMPGHKGLYGPQGTGLLLCADGAEPLLFGGTGSASIEQDMPDFLPDRNCGACRRLTVCAYAYSGKNPAKGTETGRAFAQAAFFPAAYPTVFRASAERCCLIYRRWRGLRRSRTEAVTIRCCGPCRCALCSAGASISRYT